MITDDNVYTFDYVGNPTLSAVQFENRVHRELGITTLSGADFLQPSGGNLNGSSLNQVNQIPIQIRCFFLDFIFGSHQLIDGLTGDLIESGPEKSFIETGQTTFR